MESTVPDETKKNYALLVDKKPTNIIIKNYFEWQFIIRFTALEKRWEIRYRPVDSFHYYPLNVNEVGDWGEYDGSRKRRAGEIDYLIEVEEYKNVGKMTINELKDEQKSLEKKEKSIQRRLLEIALLEIAREAEMEWRKKQEGKIGT